MSTPTLLTAWRVVNPDFTSRNGYRWPFPGTWAHPKPSDLPMTEGHACPQFDGDDHGRLLVWCRQCQL